MLGSKEMVPTDTRGALTPCNASGGTGVLGADREGDTV